MLRRLLLAACAAVLPGLAMAQGMLRIGMTDAFIPPTHGQPDQGFERHRFTGIALLDGLTAWDICAADRSSVVIPAPATKWAVDPDDRTRCIFRLRRDVRFHDGSPFDAQAVVWNVGKAMGRGA